MKKIFTKLFLLATLLMLSNELWAQDPLVMCLRSDRQTIPKNTTKDLIYNLPGPGTGLNLHLECDGGSDYYYSIYGYSELDCGGTRKTIASGSDYGLFLDYYNIEGYKSIKITITAPRRYVVEMNLDISATYADIPNPYTFVEAGYNSANASKSFTMDYYGEPTTINYEYVTGDGNSGSEKFPISFAYSNGKITMNVQYRHNEIGTHKAEIKLNYSTTNLFTRFYVSGTTIKGNQTIAWSMGNKAVNVGDQLTLDATASSGLGVTYTSSNTSVVTVSGNTIKAVGEGSATITASQSGNTNYNAAASKSYTVTVSKKDQTITWTPPTELTVGSTHTLSATAPGGAVSYEVTGDAVTRSGNTLTAVQAGTVTITASQAGNGNYNPAASVTKRITIKKATPKVTAWPTIVPVTYGTNLGAALVLKGGSVSVAGTFVITSSYTAATRPNAGTHTYSVEFRPTESNKYNNVSGGTATLTVNKADQEIAWTATPPTEMTVGDTHTLSATATSGDAVAFAVTGDAATLAGNTLTAVQAGTVTITASQVGNGNYNAAANVTHTITINKATPTVTAWPTLDTVTYGARLEPALVLVGGTASVEGTFVITDAYTAATVPNAGTHTYNLEFRPTESNKYNNVAGGTATLTVNKADQVIAWTATPPTEMTVGDSHTLSATALGGAVAFAISGDAAKLADNTLTAVQAGTITITASQAGNSNYNAAASVTKTITIKKATPTVSAWPTLDAVTYGATLEQALVLKGGSASVAGTFVITDAYTAATVPNAGAHTYSVEFRPTESNKYNNVSGGTATLTVNKADQEIAWTATPPTEMTVGDSHTLSATALGGAVAFAITGDAAKLAGNTLTAVQAGTVTITASQAGNNNYNAAANVTRTITINKATPTVTAWPTLNAVTYGATLEQALVLVGGTASVEGTFVITDAYTAATVPNAGTHTYSVEFRPTESNKYNNVSGGTATLTVNKANQVIAWDFADYTLLIGKTLELDATATCGAVTYVVNGTAISVSGTILTAIEEGTATIKATCAGDTNYNDVESMAYTITVEKDDDVTTGLDNTPSPMTNGQKIIYNGQLLIIRDGKTYNAMGQEVK